ncbi:MAG: c-type cytochrome [Cellvibrionaceae bacterium]
MLKWLGAAVLGLTVMAQASANNDEIAKRIAPVGSVCMSGEECAAAPVAEAAGSGEMSGEDVYNTKCSACHGSGLMGAPKLGAAADWAPRIAAGVDTVYANAIGGKGAMPPKGGCASCSDDNIKAAVDHMLENSK